MSALGPLVLYRSLIFLPCLGGITWPNVEKGLKNSHVSETFIFPGAPVYKCHIKAPSDHCKHLMDGLGEEDGVGAGGGALGQSRHRHYMHGVGDARARVPFFRKPQALPTFMAKFTQRSTSSAQAPCTGSLHTTGTMPWYRWVWWAVWWFHVTAMMGAQKHGGSTWPPGELTCQTPSEPSKLPNRTWSAATANSQTHEKEIIDNRNAEQKLTNCSFQNGSESYTTTWVTKGKIPEPTT